MAGEIMKPFTKPPQPNPQQSTPSQPGAESKVVDTISQSQSDQPKSTIIVHHQNKSWLEQEEDHLLTNGWIKLGIDGRGVGIWDDPLATGAKPAQTEIVRLPVQGGGEEIIRQWVGPVIQWTRVTEDAYIVQRQRELAAAK